MDELKPSEIKRLIVSLRIEARFQADRFGRRILADELREAADMIEKLSRPAALENSPLTVEQLRQMDGEPVWIVEAPDWGHWELSADAEDYLCDRDTDFYGMMYDDPAGRYGLHALGWLAYARKPEEEK